MISRVRFTLGLLLVIVLLVVYSPMTFPGFAQTATPMPTPMPWLAEDASTISLPLDYEDVILTGPYGHTVFYVGLPSHWEMLPGGSLTLLLNYITGQGIVTPVPELDSGQVSIAQTASLRLTLNGTSVYQTVLTPSDQQSLTIPLPDVWPERAPGSRNRLEVFVHMHGRCEDALVSSVTILRESFLTLVYRSGSLSLDLASYPLPFYQRTFLPSIAYVVLPSQPSSQQVAAGLSLAAGLGGLTNNNLMITATTDLDWNQAGALSEHIIVIGTPSNGNLISSLSDLTELPAPLRLRRLKLTTSGSDVTVPGDSLTYVLRVTNTEAVSPTDLYLHSWLPYQVENVNCQPDCQIEDRRASWEISSLLPGVSAAYTLTFALPVTVTLDAIDLTSELVQNQEVVNVSTMHSPVQPGATPTLTHTDQIGDVFFVLDGQAVPETDGIIQLLPSPWRPDKALLLVTGLASEAVLKAGRALGATAHFPGMRGQVALVQNVFQRPDAPREQVQDLTLADLGYPDQTVTGTGREDVYYRFDLPLSWGITQDANVRFLFSHSPLLDPTRSSITLVFNGTPIGSVALDESNTLNSELIAPLPPHSARPGQSNTLLVRVEARLPDPCAPVGSSQSWVTLNASSSLHLAHSLSDMMDRFDMDFLPLPFTARPDLGDVMLALPDRPSAVEYNAALQVASQLAASSGGDTFRPAVLLGDPAGADLSAYHLIVIGRPTRSPLLQVANDLLPQPFLLGTDVIQQQVDDIIFRLPPDLDLGYLQLIPSRWSADHALLAVTGTSDLGVGWAAWLLADSDQLWRLEGNLALLHDEEVFTTDTRGLTAGGRVAAIATAVPEATVVGTATPTPRPTPIPTAQMASDTSSVPPSNHQGPPLWLALVVGGGILAILVILGIAYWQARRRRSGR